MTGVVLGVGCSGDSGAAARWASAEAALRDLPLRLVHAWDESLDVSVNLGSGSLPDLQGAATSCAVHGPAAAVLLAQQPDLLVLGGHTGARHISHLTRSCLHHAGCPVVVVPDAERPLGGRVVVGVCGTEASRDALRWAADEARRRLAPLVVVHAWQLHPASARDLLQPTRAVAAQRAAALDRLQGGVRTVLGGDVDVEVHATHGGPLDELFHATADADLLVLGRSSHSRIGRALHGAVDADLTGLASYPVAVIPGQPKAADGNI